MQKLDEETKRRENATQESQRWVMFLVAFYHWKKILFLFAYLKIHNFSEHTFVQKYTNITKRCLIFMIYDLIICFVLLQPAWGAYRAGGQDGNGRGRGSGACSGWRRKWNAPKKHERSRTADEPASGVSEREACCSWKRSVNLWVQWFSSCKVHGRRRTLQSAERSFCPLSIRFEKVNVNIIYR